MSNLFPTMETFFRLPAEIRLEVLYFLSPGDLDLLFSLSLLPDPRYDPYITIRHQALVARYARQDLVMSNFPRVELLSIQDLDYLIHHKLLISARSVTFVFHATCDCLETYMSCLWQRYLHILERFTKDFNIRVLLANSFSLASSVIDNWFRPLLNSSSNVNWFTIKYSMGPEWESHNVPSWSSTREGSELSSAICPKNLQLQLFDSGTLLRHMANSNGCFHCESLKTIDLSFNNLRDEDLGKIRFPPNLEEINLLNNMLLVLSNSSFSFIQLTKLKELNLSNNNIMRIKLRNIPDQGQFQVLKVNLSGNILTDYSLLFTCDFFEAIRELDLSNNLLGELTPFPATIKKLNLYGNHYHLLTELISQVFPDRLEQLRIAMPPGEQFRFDELAEAFVNAAKFLTLKELRIGCCLPEIRCYTEN